MAPYKAVDPEVIGLLQEVAIAERSELFEVAPARFARHPIVDVPRFSATSTLLSGAERRLLETRREELGLLLYWYGYRVRNANPRLAHTYHDSVTVDRSLDAPSGRELAARAQRLSTGTGGGALDASEDEALACLRGCMGGGPLSPDQIMVAGLRVAPSDAMRMCLGADLYTAGRARSSGRVLRDLLESRPSALLVSYTLEELGWQACTEGRYPEAAGSYRQASEADETRSMPPVLWLFSAVQAGDVAQAREAAGRVDDMVGREHSSIRWFVDGHATDRSRGGWEPTRASAACASALADVGPASGEVLSVFD